MTMKLDDIISNFARLSLDAISIGYCPPGETWARHVWSNAAFRDLFGASDIDIVGRRVELMFDPDTLDELVAQVRPAIQNGDDSVQVEAWARRLDGRRFRVNANIIFFPSDEEGGRFSAAVYRDVTALREQDRAAQQALVEREALAGEVLALQNRLMSAINTLPGPLAIWDKDFRLVVCNSAFAPRILGQSVPPSVGTLVDDVIRQASTSGMFADAIGREADWLEESLADLRDGGINNRTRYTDGRIFQAESTQSENGDMLILSTDVTEFVEQEEMLKVYAAELEKINGEMEYKAFHDDLTGLKNRRYLTERLAETMADRAEGRGELAILQIDLDRFKQINDTLGHAAGDHVLKEVADRLARCVGPEDVLARAGGDEFVVLVRFTEIEDLRALADRIVAALAEPVHYRDAEFRAGGSVGVAHTPVSDLDTLLTGADVALYRAKDTGRGRAVYFETRDLDYMREHKALADDILRGLDADEFEPWFQPQIDAVTGRLVGLEALVRWNHPTRGVLPPGVFLETADELGRLAEIDNRMFRKAMELRRSHDFGDEMPGLSFNISTYSLMSDDLSGLAREAGRAPFEVAFELLETIYLEENADAILLRLDALRDAGVTVEMDDFGSGRASVVALQQLAPDRMKIDRRLVAPIVASEQSCALVRSIVDIGHALGIKVTAEGVETEQHVEVLREIGCDRLQGYHISKPISFDDVIARYGRPTAQAAAT